MRKLVILILYLVAACSPTPTVTPLPNPTLANVPTSPVSANTVTAAPQVGMPTAPLQPTQANVPNTAGLWLQILSPLDEAVVNTPQVDVMGSAPAGAVISIDEQILIVGSDLQFRTSLILEEGPNLIEIIASDENGNEMTALLTVIYEP